MQRGDVKGFFLIPSDVKGVFLIPHILIIKPWIESLLK